MGVKNREELHKKLLTICPNVYFQPPSNVVLKYPCIIYDKANLAIVYANNIPYVYERVFRIKVLDGNPDSKLPDKIVTMFPYVTNTDTFTMDNIYHTVLTIKTKF